MLRLFVATCTRQGLASRTSSNQLRKPCNFVVASKWMSSKPTEPYDPSEPNEPTIPPFIEKFEEPIHEKRARLLYQVSLSQLKKMKPLQFCFPVFIIIGIYRNPKQKEIFNSCEGFLK